jgi:hypothetical protein
VLTSPDYGAPTLGYYLRNSPVMIYGFARWYDPEYFRIGDYAAVWSEPQAIAFTLRQLQILRRHGYTQLVLVRPLGLAYDAGHIRFEREIDLQKRLGAHFRVVRTLGYSGREERATLTVLDLRTDRCPACS